MEVVKSAMDAIYSHAAVEHPLECVGLVWSDGSITRLINQSRSSTEFSVGRSQLADALALVDPDEKTLAAVYHSHPGGTAGLSSQDRESLRAQYLDGLYVPWVVVLPHDSYAIYEWDVLFDAPKHVETVEMSHA